VVGNWELEKVVGNPAENCLPTGLSRLTYILPACLPAFAYYHFNLLTLGPTTAEALRAPDY